tara:strand:- start:5 stop:1039 length:1035 start_codon:yes stop_codon:yes gene_type:complete
MRNFIDKKVNICPSCLGKNFQKVTSNYLNVYSELISTDLGITEKKLIDDMTSLKCTDCELKFWANPLNIDIRLKLYTEILPIHPKGDDSSGMYFNYDGLCNKIKGESKKSSKRLRIIDGYLSSIKFNSNKEYQQIKSQLIESEDYKFIKDKLDELFKRGPLDFSRHAGFRNTSINEDIINVILRNKSNNLDYIEYGSLDWGPINSKEFIKFKCLHIIPNNDIFWNSQKRILEGTLKHKYTYEKDMFKDYIELKGASLGLILIIDHLKNPYLFLKEFVNKNVKDIFVLVEKEEDSKGLPVQHLTSWNHKSLKRLGEKLGLNVSFPEINTQKYIYTKFTNKNLNSI